MTYSVFCKSRFIAFHVWDNAPESVAYLRSTHRHEFHVQVFVDVSDPDRAVEFHTLKALVEQYCQERYVGQVLTISCEKIAGEILQRLARAGYEVIGVEVSEDGECGGVAWSK